MKIKLELDTYTVEQLEKLAREENITFDEAIEKVVREFLAAELDQED